MCMLSSAVVTLSDSIRWTVEGAAIAMDSYNPEKHLPHSSSKVRMKRKSCITPGMMLQASVHSLRSHAGPCASSLGLLPPVQHSNAVCPPHLVQSTHQVAFLQVIPTHGTAAVCTAVVSDADPSCWCS